MSRHKANPSLCVRRGSFQGGWPASHLGTSAEDTVSLCRTDEGCTEAAVPSGSYGNEFVRVSAINHKTNSPYGSKGSSFLGAHTVKGSPRTSGKDGISLERRDERRTELCVLPGRYGSEFVSVCAINHKTSPPRPNEGGFSQGVWSHCLPEKSLRRQA